MMLGGAAAWTVAVLESVTISDMRRGPLDGAAMPRSTEKMDQSADPILAAGSVLNPSVRMKPRGILGDKRSESGSHSRVGASCSARGFHAAVGKPPILDRGRPILSSSDGPRLAAPKHSLSY
ncbi:hypothetical protein V6N13_115938 [Hibiscus sabdariffa]